MYHMHDQTLVLDASLEQCSLIAREVLSTYMCEIATTKLRNSMSTRVINVVHELVLDQVLIMTASIM